MQPSRRSYSCSVIKRIIHRLSCTKYRVGKSFRDCSKRNFAARAGFSVDSETPSGHLQTSLERVCAGMDKSKWKKAEQHLLRQFQRRLHQYANVIPEVDDTLEWLALM